MSLETVYDGGCAVSTVSRLQASFCGAFEGHEWVLHVYRIFLTDGGGVDVRFTVLEMYIRSMNLRGSSFTIITELSKLIYLDFTVALTANRDIADTGIEM